MTLTPRDVCLGLLGLAMCLAALALVVVITAVVGPWRLIRRQLQRDAEAAP